MKQTCDLYKIQTLQQQHLMFTQFSCTRIYAIWDQHSGDYWGMYTRKESLLPKEKKKKHNSS